MRLPLLILICGLASLSPTVVLAQSDSVSFKGAELINQGEHEKGLALLETEVKTLKNKDRVNGLLFLGENQRRLGYFSKAIRNFQEALALSQKSKDPISEAIALNNLGNTYRTLGELNKAEDFLRKSLNIAKNTKNTAVGVSALNNLGLLYRQKKDFSNALQAYESAKNIADALLSSIPQESSGYQQALLTRATILSNFGFLYDRLGKSSAAFTGYFEALKIHQQLKNIANQGLILGNIGLAYQTQGQFPQAAQFIAQSIAIAESQKEILNQAIAYRNLGFLMLEQGQNRLAILMLKQSVNAYESIRQRVKGLPAETQEIFASTLAPMYRQLIQLLLADNRIVEAAIVADLLKVQELDDFLKDVRGNNVTARGIALLTAETQVLNLFRELQVLLELDQTGRISPAQKERLQQLTQQATDPQTRMHNFLMSSTVNQILSTINVNEESIKFGDVQKLLQSTSNALYLTVIIFDDRIEILALPSNKPAIRKTVAISSNRLEKLLKSMRSDLLDSTSEDIKTSAKQMYDLLIAPIAPELQQLQVKTILYAPDGILRYVPLGAFFDGKEWLAQKYNINKTTSLLLTDHNLRFDRSATPKVLAGAASQRQNIQLDQQTFSFSAIPNAKTEAERVAARFAGTRLLIDKDFKRDITEQELGRFNIIHLATHGKFRDDIPERSFLVFGDGKVITLKELQNWKLRNTGLVILSACETGVGSGLTKSGNQLGSGIEVLGIGYQVQRAGAKAVIATLWQVSDEATIKLMDNFYNELRKPNTSPTEALTRAQNILIADKKTQHPYFWSAFFLIGNGL